MDPAVVSCDTEASLYIRRTVLPGYTGKYWDSMTSKTETINFPAKTKKAKIISFSMGTAQSSMVVYSLYSSFIQWGVAVFEFRGAPFWSQTFCFAQTDGITLQSYSI